MAAVTVRIGAIDEAIQYDDTDYSSAIETTARIKAGDPIEANDVVTLGSLTQNSDVDSFISFLSGECEGFIL